MSGVSNTDWLALCSPHFASFEFCAQVHTAGLHAMNIAGCLQAHAQLCAGRQR